MILIHGAPILVAVMTTLLTMWALRAVLMERLAYAALATGLVAGATMWLEPGVLSAVLALPYAIVCAIAGLEGVRRVLGTPWPPTKLATHMGLVVLAGAVVWLVAYRAGYPLLGR